MDDSETVRSPGHTVVAYTTEDDQHGEVRLAAQSHALEHGCVLILYAADAASAFSDPMPNEWASEGEGDRFSDRLDPEDLEMLGRAEIAQQVRSSRGAGVDTAAWLPKDKGVRALAEYAIAEGAHSVYVSEAHDAIDELRASLEGGETASGARDVIDIDVVTVAVPPEDVARR